MKVCDPPVGLVFLGDLAVAAPSAFYLQPAGLAPLVTEPMADLWPDYLNDTNIRKDYFIPDTELLRTPPSDTRVNCGTTTAS